ncbi:MAG: DUF975 family protein [Limosilactobacillus sp.]|uniref:DUF975 family protein n=1 Tax=Limosilactobacillus sp. TaxID=2773925 RepID=UPI0026F5250D|nr:DUF975 family protein [Limosilactobacillus sp.]
MKTRKELKTEAKHLLVGNWGTAIKLNIFNILGSIFVTMVLVIATSAFAYFVWHSGDRSFSSYFDLKGSSPTTDSDHYGSIIGDLITTYFILSVQFTMIKWVRTKQATETPFKDAFSAFRVDVPGIFVLFILQRIWTFLWGLLLVIPGIIKSYSYSMTYFIFKDAHDAGKTGQFQYTNYVTLSRKLMDGHKWEYFLLQLSFLGWNILGWLTLGIAFIWIAPYKQMTYMNYYANLVDGHDFAEDLKK